MKTTILFEPKLLAEVERESPDLYEYYCSCHLSEMEFVDYGHEGTPCFMTRELMDCLELISKHRSINLSKIITTLQTGYHFGMMDAKKRWSVDHAEFIEDRDLQLSVFDLILNYAHYELEILFDKHNFGMRDIHLYSLITYKEAQYYMAWETIFRYHREFNDVFEEINVARKKHTKDVISWSHLNSLN